MLCTTIALPYCDECDQARNDKGFSEKPSILIPATTNIVLL